MPNALPPTLLLVDGSSYLYRAFHALPDLRNREGHPTGAMVGVLKMLQRLRADYQPQYAACVFDARGPNFRHQLYPDYKAHRPPMPPDLALQIEPLHQAIRALGWPLLSIDAVEADDVIGTLARQARQQGLGCVISTGDKDMVQLLEPGLTLVNTMSNEVLDEAAAQVKYGVTAAQFLDYLTLMGDSSDNVPGVTKVGPKTAQKWITQFGSLDNLLAHAGEVSGAAGENLRTAATWLPTARQLLTIRCDVELPQQPRELVFAPPDQALLQELLERYQLRSALKPVAPPAAANPPADLFGAVPSPAIVVAEPAPPVDYQAITTAAQLEALLAEIEAAPLVSLDTETDSLNPMAAHLVGISFATLPHRAAYLPLGHRGPDSPVQLPREETLMRLRPWLENPARAKLGQHLKYDSHVFANEGITLRGIVHDTLLQSYVLEAHLPHKLESLALRHLGRETISYEAVAGKGVRAITFDQVPLAAATEYACEDADITLQVHQKLYPQLEQAPALLALYRDLELPVQHVLWQMERNGVLLDSQELARQSQDLGQRLLELETKIHQAAGHPFNINSPRQISAVLFEEQGLPVKKKTPGGDPSTDEAVLQELALDYPVPRLILEYRSLAKLKSTYTDKLPQMVNHRTGRVHTHYAQAVAVTGRLSSQDPNLQNIPVRTPEGRRIRQAFIAPPNQVLVSADYSQIELRIMAHLSGDEGLLSAFAQGLDVHRATAAEIFGVAVTAVTDLQRRTAKSINFGLIYGMSAFGLAAQLGIERSAAQQYMNLYFQRYPGVARYMEETRDQARARGYVETLFGRRLFLPEISQGSVPRRQAAERAAINAPMQGTAADLIKRAMLAVQAGLETHGLESLLIMQVHDELVLQVPQNEIETIRQYLPQWMTGVAQLSVPLQVDLGVGPNWEQAH
jgi:DNA polymerase-1